MPDIDATEFGLWPTPTQDSVNERTKEYSQGGTPLTMAVNMWPTPTASMAKTAGGCSQDYIDRRKLVGLNDLAEKVVDGQVGNGTLNPEWVEWLMGYPQGWTDCAD
jgi:hypothetical protein